MLLMNCPYFERQKMFFDFDGFGLYRRSVAADLQVRRSLQIREKML